MRTLAQIARTAPILALAFVAGTTLPALTSPAMGAAEAPSSVRSDPRRNTLKLLSKRITVNFDETPLSEVFAYIKSSTGANILAYDIEEDPDAGFDPLTPITLKVENRSALETIERVLNRINRDPNTISKFTWQLTEQGEFEIGSRTALNRTTRIELYDIQDLLFIAPYYDNAPEFDLGNILSQSGQRGGGGGSQLFNTSGDDAEREPLADRVQAIIDLITNNIEPDGWIALGGDAAAIESYNGQLVVTAPDYIHRQIDGYSFWPRSLHKFGTRGARRFIEVVPAPQRP